MLYDLYSVKEITMPEKAYLCLRDNSRIDLSHQFRDLKNGSIEVFEAGFKPLFLLLMLLFISSKIGIIQHSAIPEIDLSPLNNY